MIEALRAIAIRRLRTIPVGKFIKSSKKRKLIFLTELAGMGYHVANPSLYNDSVVEHYSSLTKTLKEMKGGNVKYVPLFTGFPDDVPDQDEYFAKRIVGFIANIIDQFADLFDGTFIDGKTLDNGIKVPSWLFDLKEFGADPITQFQDRELFEKGAKNQAKRKGDTKTVWTQLRLALEPKCEQLLKKFLLDSLYAKSSIKEALKPDIEFLLKHFGVKDIVPSLLVFKETRTYVMKYCWERDDLESVKKLSSTPTDLLRLFAALTDGDVSLTAPIKFPKLARRHRRLIMDILDNNKNPHLVDDLVAYKGLWLALGKSIHAGEFKRQFPRAWGAFDTIRNKKPVTFNSAVEKAIKNKNVEVAVALLSERPGVFARKLHHLLEIAGARPAVVLNAFKEAAGDIALKNLLVMERYFETIEDSDLRTVINKAGRIRVMDNKKNRIKVSAKSALVEAIQKAITAKIRKTKPLWRGKKVWIDDRLKSYAVPLQQRKASDGLINVGRGSKVPLEKSDVLRLFVYWKESGDRTDLDLSLIQYDEDMKYVGQVSWTNLAEGGILHSGDLQSAPHGAAEFIDIDLSKVDKASRYIAPQIYKYSGDSFADLEICHAGWMLRDKVDNDRKSFDIKTVQHKFNMSGSAGYAIPIVVDLKEMEITFVDLYVGKVSPYNRVEGAYKDISIITKEMVRMLETKPNMYDLAKHNLAGRGGSVAKTKGAADVSIGITNCDFNVSDVEKVLNELI